MSIGYACIVIGVPGLSLKSCTLKYATVEKLKHVALHNLWVLSDVVDYNLSNGILLFRISSDIIPFGSHPVNRQEWWKDYSELLSSIGSKIRNSGMRVSMHPGQYTVLNSPDSDVVERAILDLQYHVCFLDALGVDRSHKIILHIGGVYGNKEQSVNRFIQNCKYLPDKIKNRLVLENDEKSYNIADVLAIADEVSLPVVFDNLHHSMNMPIGEANPFRWIKRCRRTWKSQDGRQKIHYSQQMAGGRPGAHSLTIDVSEFISFYSALSDPEVDIMLEVKDKNLSAIKCIRAAEQHADQSK
jgi:UV DNA damage endonuclease